MVELQLSKANSKCLQNFFPAAPPNPSQHGSTAPDGTQQLFSELLTSLDSAADEGSRRHALLQLVASLLSEPAPVLYDQKPARAAAASSLVPALLKIARPLSQATDDRYATHALVVELVLAALELLSRSGVFLPDEEALVLIVAYTNANDPWTTQSSAALATDLVAPYVADDKLAPFIVGSVLQVYIRPIFSQSSDAAPRRGEPIQGRHQSSHEKASWKEQDPLVASVFYWAVDMADARLIAGNWPLFLPVLLALAEDQDISVREHGLGVLNKFLQKCSPEMLLSTGLGTIFEDAVFPSLLILPNWADAQTRANHTLCLAYDALLQLARADRDRLQRGKRRLLDRLVRHGILAGHLNTSTPAAVIETLMNAVAATVDCMGIFAAKHLQVLLQSIDSVMTDPFAATRPSTVLASNKALNALVANCWPRMLQATHTEHVLRIIATCWVNAHDGGVAAEKTATDEVACMRAGLLSTSRMLHSIWQDGLPNELQRKFSDTLSREPRLRPLLQPMSSSQKTLR